MNTNENKSCYWSLFQKNFINIINENTYYKCIFEFLQTTQNNALLYGAYGFPTDLFIDEIIKHKFNIITIYKKECTWNKDIVYYSNQHFLELNLMHPSMPKDMSIITKFIISIIKNKNINEEKHFIIIKNIDLLNNKDFNCFRIILERFSNNVYFLCTTHKLDKIDVPVKSRFALIRMPLFQHSEIVHIFDEYLHIPLNKYLIENKTRNIIKAIYIANCRDTICTRDFCLLNFPPIFEFYKNLKKHTIEDFRNFAYKCFQYNIGISELLCDLLKLLPNKHKKKSHINSI